MSKRINITIPDNLFERLEIVKEKMNVSAICQTAIESAVKTEEIKMSAMSKRESAIARLKIEAQNETDEWFQKGKRQGLEIAPDLSYTEFRQALEWHEAKYSTDGWQISLLDLMSHNCFDSIIDAAKNEECPDDMMESYALGGLDGIVEFWDSIQGELA